MRPAAPRLPPRRAPQAAEQLRPIWRGLHEQHSYPEFEAEWRRAVNIFSCASRAYLVPPPPGCDGLPAAMGSSAVPTSSGGSDSPPAPAPHDSAAPMLID